MLNCTVITSFTLDGVWEELLWLNEFQLLTGLASRLVESLEDCTSILNKERNCDSYSCVKIFRPHQRYPFWAVVKIQYSTL